MKKIQNRKLLLIALAAVLLLSCIGGYAYLRGRSSEPPMPEGVNLNPPTDAEKEETERHKDELSKTPAQNDEPELSPKEVAPIITSWGQTSNHFELAARIPGIFEEGGKCTLTLKHDGSSVSATSSSIQNVSDVSCGFIKVPLSKLSSGMWQATVSYSSDTAKGTSNTVEVTVK